MAIVPAPHMPELLKPIPVIFVTDSIRLLQSNALTGSLGQATGTLLEDVMFRQSVDDAMANSVDASNRFEEEGRVPTAEELQEERENDCDDPVIAVLEGVVNGILTGESLDPHREKIRSYIMNQEDRSELISNLALTKDYARFVQFMKARDKLESQLLSAAHRDDLNVSESLALNTVITGIVNRLEGRVQAGASNVGDIMALLTKVDYTLQNQDNQFKSKLKDTTPAGREIVRRVLHGLHKMKKGQENDSEA